MLYLLWKFGISFPLFYDCRNLKKEREVSNSMAFWLQSVEFNLVNNSYVGHCSLDGAIQDHLSLSDCDRLCRISKCLVYQYVERCVFGTNIKQGTNNCYIPYYPQLDSTNTTYPVPIQDNTFYYVMLYLEFLLLIILMLCIIICIYQMMGYLRIKKTKANLRSQTKAEPTISKYIENIEIEGDPNE